MKREHIAGAGYKEDKTVFCSVLFEKEGHFVSLFCSCVGPRDRQYEETETCGDSSTSVKCFVLKTDSTQINIRRCHAVVFVNDRK